MKLSILFPSPAVVAALALLTGSTLLSAPAPIIPSQREESVLVSAAATDEWPYLAFPALVDLGKDVLVSYKRGQAHAKDPGAVLEMIRIDAASGRVTERKEIAALPERIMQMGEWVRFPNGDLANYIDAQQTVVGAERVGLRVVRSTDGGRSFGSLERVGPIDGVEYGYAFDAINEGKTTWMLVMTFSYLQGGRSLHDFRPVAGSVDVVRSDDNGRSWRFVRGLNAEFGNVPINESAFLRHGDGFLVTTRGYDNRQRLHFTDAEFRVRRQIDLTETHPFIASYVGRPRLFARDGRVYLVGRNWTKSGPPAPPRMTPTGSGPMQLCLFRLDPESLKVASWALLDNADNRNVTDAYYAVPYFRETDGRTLMHLITYKGLDRAPPQIVRITYRWDEVR